MSGLNFVTHAHLRGGPASKINKNFGADDRKANLIVIVVREHTLSFLSTCLDDRSPSMILLALEVPVADECRLCRHV